MTNPGSGRILVNCGAHALPKEAVALHSIQAWSFRNMDQPMLELLTFQKPPNQILCENFQIKYWKPTQLLKKYSEAQRNRWAGWNLTSRAPICHVRSGLRAPPAVTRSGASPVFTSPAACRHMVSSLPFIPCSCCPGLTPFASCFLQEGPKIQGNFLKVGLRAVVHKVVVSI